MWALEEEASQVSRVEEVALDPPALDRQRQHAIDKAYGLITGKLERVATQLTGAPDGKLGLQGYPKWKEAPIVKITPSPNRWQSRGVSC